MNIRFLPPQVDDWILAREKPARSAGYHVSGVILAMLKKLDPSKYGKYSNDAPDDGKKALWELGYLWEDVLSAVLADRLKDGRHGERPIGRLELERDGVFGSPDQILLRDADGRLIIEESKATFTSCAKAEGRAEQPDPNVIASAKEFRSWVWQARTYAAMAHTYQIRDGRRTLPVVAPLVRIRALFLRGDYASRLVVPLCWELDHTAEELEQWWATVREFVTDYPELVSKELAS